MNRTANPTYSTVHSRLVAAYGRASEHSCAVCGEPAKHWSYNNDPEGAMVDTRVRVLYSPDLTRYDPLCIRCHGARDASARMTCLRGHPFTEANSYRRKDNGCRQCRACKAERERERTRRRRAA